MTDWQTIKALVPRGEILAQLAEECAELGQAALKLRRALTGDNPTPVSADDAEDHLWEEVADVILCVNLLGEWPVIDGVGSAIEEQMDKKEARWARRLRAVYGEDGKP